MRLKVDVLGILRESSCSTFRKNFRFTIMTDFRKIISEFSVEPRAFGQHDALLVKEECKQRPGRAGFHQGVQSRQPRWKTGIRYCSLAAGIIFFLNLMFLLIAEG